MKVVVKIVRCTCFREDFLIISKDKEGNDFTFYLKGQLPLGEYYLLNMEEYDFSITNFALFHVKKFTMEKLQVVNGRLSLMGTPVKSDRLVVRNVQVQKLVELTRRFNSIERSRKRKAS